MMADRQDYPPVALSRLDDRTGWRWLNYRPAGVLDWTLTATVLVLGIVPVLVLMPVCWVLRRIVKAGEPC